MLIDARPVEAIFVIHLCPANYLIITLVYNLIKYTEGTCNCRLFCRSVFLKYSVPYICDSSSELPINKQQINK